MGLLTLAELRSELYSRVDTADEFNPATNSANCDRALNFSYQRLQLPTVFNHIETQTTQNVALVTGQQGYTITLHAINHIRYNQVPRQLRPMSIRQQGSLIINNGPPTRYARWGTSIYLDFIPTAVENGQVLTVYGWAQPIALAASGPASILNSVFDEIILTGGEWRAWRRLGDGPKADMMREEYGALINDNKDVLAQEGFDQGFMPDVGTAADYQTTW